jgi:tetraacyldisaccharide 4'-kinase
MRALARATAFVVTRADFAHPPLGLEKELRRQNPAAPIFRSRLVPAAWVEKDSQIAVSAQDPHFGRAAAFCGLGNPRSFWSTLEELSLPVCFRWAFGDHHSYRADELRRLAQQAIAHGAECLVTTEKDAVNLPGDASAIVAPLRLYWLRIGVEIEREDELIKLIS